MTTGGRELYRASLRAGKYIVYRCVRQLDAAKGRRSYSRNSPGWIGFAGTSKLCPAACAPLQHLCRFRVCRHQEDLAIRHSTDGAMASGPLADGVIIPRPIRPTDCSFELEGFMHLSRIALSIVL